MALIESNAIAGLSIYGVQQKDYTVKGEANCDYLKAASVAMFQESGAIEAEAAAYGAILEARQRKLDELAEALATITQANASLKTKNPKSSDKCDPDPALKTAATILDRYRRESNADLKLPVDSKNQATRGDLQSAQSALQYEIDYESNEMQQDMVTMESIVSKRDNAYSTVASLVQKITSTGSALINNL
jgi:hypothetical protein